MAVTRFKFIQNHYFWYQSKARRPMDTCSNRSSCFRHIRHLISEINFLIGFVSLLRFSLFCLFSNNSPSSLSPHSYLPLLFRCFIPGSKRRLISSINPFHHRFFTLTGLGLISPTVWLCSCSFHPKVNWLNGLRHFAHRFPKLDSESGMRNLTAIFSN